MVKLNKEFLVFRKSENTNSFGLFQMYLMAEDGEAYTSCANSLNAKQVGEMVIQTIEFNYETGERGPKYFIGHELTESLSRATQDVVKEVFKLKKD